MSQVNVRGKNVRGDVRGKMSELIMSELRMPTLYQVILYYYLINMVGFLSILGGPPPKKKKRTVDFQDFALINSFLFTLLDRAYLLHYTNTKIIKFG